MDSEGQELGHCRIGRFVTAPPFLAPKWDDLNTGSGLLARAWNHLEVYLVV